VKTPLSIPQRDGAAGPRALVDEVTERLETAILSGELGPGAKLSEQSLSARYGVGRGPLREAIRTLEGRRLVERTPFSGARVIQLSVDEFEQLLITREVLEGLACRQAAECMTLHETRRLRGSLSVHGKAIDAEGWSGVFAHGSREQDFHVQIVHGSRNRWLYEFLCRDLYALLKVFRVRSARLKERASDAAREHLAIIEAIERRDPDEAEHLMRRHIANARDNMIRDLRKMPEPNSVLASLDQDGRSPGGKTSTGGRV